MPVMPASLSYRLKKSWTVTRAGRDRLQGDLQLLLGLDRLVQSVLPLPAGHHTAGELVDDDHLAVDHDIVAVAEVGDLAAERPLDVFVEPVNRERDESRSWRRRPGPCAGRRRVSSALRSRGSYL